MNDAKDSTAEQSAKPVGVSRRLEPGLMVQVFRDPMERTRLEGEAKLVERQSHHHDPKGLELWLVQFSDDEPAYSRLVHPDCVVAR